MDPSAKRFAQSQESPLHAKKAKCVAGPTLCMDMLAEGGCTASDGSEPFQVEDPRVLRRYLVLHLAEDADTKAAFTKSMQVALQEQAVLGSALLPMEVSAEGVPMTGDSLIRLLLNMTGIQTALACALVQKLPSAMETEGSQEADSVPGRILGSLRWLDEVVDAHQITCTLLDVMPKCIKSVQQGILELLPELVLEEDCQAVIVGLVEMTEGNSTLLVPVLEAISNITAQDTGQAQVTDLVLQRFQTAELADLPALLRFLLQHVNPQNAHQVVELLRCSMPSLGNKAVQISGEMVDVEESAVEAMRTGLQCSHLAADTVFSHIKALTEAEKHLGLDLWLLLLLASLAGKRSQAVHKLLKKKFAEGLADSAWLDSAVCGHQGALKSLFPSLLEVAGRLVQTGQAGCQAAASHLYTLLFAADTTHTAAQHQQEVLGGLQGHLGSGQAGEISTALAVLLTLTGEHACQLLQHVDFLTSLLDCLDTFSQAQLHQVFEVVTKLVVATKSATTEEETKRQRLGQQLEMLLQKQMQSEEMHSQRVGIIGTIKLAERLAASSSMDQRSKEAEELLGRSFGVRQQQPAMFGLMCDELTQAVAAGRLSASLREWLRASATDQLEGFLDDFNESVPDVQCEGGDTIEGANWMNLNGSAGQVMLPLLRIVCSTEREHRQSLAYLCAVTRLALTLDFQMMGSLDGLSAILGCPLHMPRLDKLHRPALLAACPHQQWVLCSSLLLAINWIRELLNAWAHHIQPHQCLGGVEVQQNLLVRLQNLCQLEALLAHTLTLLPNPPSLHTFSACSPPAGLVKKAQVQKKSRSKKSKAAQSTEDTSEPADDQENIANNASPTTESAAYPENSMQGLSRMPEVQAQLRCLDPHVLSLLGQVQCAALPQAALAPAALLMEELHGKLVEAMTRARRPAFLNAAAAQDQPTGAHQTPQQIWGELENVLPALRHLLSSCSTLSASGLDELAEGQSVVAARVEGASQEPTPDLLLTDHPIATAALAPEPAAARVLQRGLHCIQQLTAAEWLKQPQHRGLLQAFVRAFGQQSDSPEKELKSKAGVMKAFEVIEGCLHACDTFKGLSKGPQGSLEQEVALLHIQANLVDIAEGIPGNASTRHSLAMAKEGVSTAAEHILQQGSEPQTSQPSDSASAQPADPPAGGGVGWKGQQGVLGDLIHLWVSWSPQPCQTVLGLLQGALAQVPSQPLTGKKAQEPVHPYPGLTGSSLHVWYKALFQEVLQQWSRHANSVAALHKTRQGPLQQEGADAALLQLQHCGKAFASLLALNKIHLKRIQMHSQALRCGGKVIQHCLRTLPFWEAWYGAHPNQVEPFSRALKDVQSGTRILYVICAEGKANKNITIANLVVGTKHVLEEFRVGVTAVMLAAKQHISQGNLKHKDLTGQEVSSQVPFTQVQIDEDVSDSEQQVQDAGGSDTE